jgi:hypothetical protein
VSTWKAPGKQKGGREKAAPGQKVWAALAIAVSLLIVGAAQLDIQGRRETEVRGRKLLWRIVSLNALGALVYFLFGRREPVAGGEEPLAAGEEPVAGGGESVAAGEASG